MLAQLQEFRQEIVNLPRTDGIDKISLRHVVNAKVKCVLAGADARIQAFKVVEAIDESAAEKMFSLMELCIDRKDRTMELTENRAPFTGPAYLALTIPVPQGEVDLLFTAEAIELHSDVPFRSLNCKVRAGLVKISKTLESSSVVVDAGRVDLLSALGPSSHFVEMKAGELLFSRTVQCDLVWRLATRLGEIREASTGKTHPSPFTGVIGNGAGRLTCSLEVGNITVT